MDPKRIERILDAGHAARRTGVWTIWDPPSTAETATGFGALRVSGKDTAAFLQNALTNDLLRLKDGDGTLCARLDRTGRLRALLSAHRLQSSQDGACFLLVLEASRANLLKADLETYVISEDVRIEDLSSHYTWATVQGPASATVAANMHEALTVKQSSPLPEYSVRTMSSNKGLPRGTVVCARSLFGDPGLLFAVPLQAEVSWRERFAAVARAQGLIELTGSAGEDLTEALRLEGGLPDLKRDGAEGRVLPETSLEEQTVSQTKGCYLGQEIIARMRTYGSPTHALRALILVPDGDGIPPEQLAALYEDLPGIGEALHLIDGREAGRLASRAPSPLRGAILVLAWLGRDLRAPGQQLSCRGRRGTFRARVELHPIYRATDRVERARFLYREGVRAFADGRDDESLSLFEDALNLDPSFADAYETLGVVLGRAERFEEAVAVFKRMEEVAPHEPMVHTNLSLFYMRMGNKELAEEHKAKAMMTRFRTIGAEAETKRQRAEETERRKDEARRRRETFTEVLTLDPDDPLALFGLANALEELGELEEAERTLARACRAQHDNSAFHLAHGRLLERLDRPADASEVYRAGVQVAARKGDFSPLKQMEQRLALLDAQKTTHATP